MIGRPRNIRLRATGVDDPSLVAPPPYDRSIAAADIALASLASCKVPVLLFR